MTKGDRRGNREAKKPKQKKLKTVSQTAYKMDGAIDDATKTKPPRGRKA